MTATMYEKISKAPIEEVLCLAVLIAAGNLPPSATLEHATEFYQNGGHCDWCPNVNRCLACIINE